MNKCCKKLKYVYVVYCFFIRWKFKKVLLFETNKKLQINHGQGLAPSIFFICFVWIYLLENQSYNKKVCIKIKHIIIFFNFCWNKSLEKIIKNGDTTSFAFFNISTGSQQIQSRLFRIRLYPLPFLSLCFA